MPIQVNSQYQYNIRPISKNVVKISQIHFNGIFRKSGWKSIYEFSDGKLTRQRNWYKGDLRFDEKHNYQKDKSIIIKKTIDSNNAISSITKDSIPNQLRKREFYVKNDTVKPVIVLHSYLYDSIDQLVSYKWTSEDYEGNETTDCSKLKYKKNELIIQELEECSRINKTITVKFDSKGNPISETINYHDPTIIITGGRSEKGIIRYKYKYDKKGNWIKRYYVTSKGKSILEFKRKIKYQ